MALPQGPSKAEGSCQLWALQEGHFQQIGPAPFAWHLLLPCPPSPPLAFIWFVHLAWPFHPSQRAFPDPRTTFISSPPKWDPFPTESLPNFPSPQPLASANLFSVSVGLSFWLFHVNKSALMIKSSVLGVWFQPWWISSVHVGYYY